MDEHTLPAIRILFVEDSPDDVDLVLLHLRTTYDVTHARVETRAALDAALAEPWDLCLCDYALPGYSPLAVLQQIQDRNLDLPLVALSGVISEEQAAAMMLAGARDWVWKNNLMRLGPVIAREQRDRAVRHAARQVTRQYEAEQQARLATVEETIEAWARALELRDDETEGHSQRVTRMAVRVARRMGLVNGELEQVYFGSLLHDIGKMGIPDSILLKRGPLTPVQRKKMRQHPTLAYELLHKSLFLRSALDIPYCHHERWDGKGYPRGLKGQQIPRAARIFAVCDVFDALTSKRVYRRAWGVKRTMAEIRKGAGSQFDPEVVKTFGEMIEDGSL